MKRHVKKLPHPDVRLRELAHKVATKKPGTYHPAVLKALKYLIEKRI